MPGILQARTLGWVAISFSSAWKVKVKSLSHVSLFMTPWTAAYQAPLSKGFSRQEYWSEMPCLPLENQKRFSEQRKRVLRQKFLTVWSITKSDLMSTLVSQGCQNKVTHTGWLTMTEIYSLMQFWRLKFWHQFWWDQFLLEALGRSCSMLLF